MVDTETLRSETINRTKLNLEAEVLPDDGGVQKLAEEMMVDESAWEFGVPAVKEEPKPKAAKGKAKAAGVVSKVAKLKEPYTGKQL